MRILCAAVTTTTAMFVGMPCIAAAESPLRLSYVSDERCPNRDDVAQQLLSRTHTMGALTQTQIRVTVVAREGGYVGRLDLVDPQGSRIEREFSGPTCSEVTQAIALVAAVTIDGSTTPVATAGQATSANDATPASDTHPVESPRISADSHTSVAAPPKPESPSAPHARRLNPFSLGAVGGLHAALSPYATPTLGLSLGYHPTGVWGTPLYRLSGVVGKSRAKAVSFDATNTGKAEFLWLAARALVCPVAIATSRMRLGPCALVELGALKGSGTSNNGQGSSTGWWFAPGAVLEWSAQFDPIRMSLTGGGVRPVAREHFKFQPNFEVFRPPNVGLLAEIGIGWTFE